MIGEIVLETPRLILSMWDEGDGALIRDRRIETTRYLSGAAPWTLEKAEERLSNWFGEQQRVTKYKILKRDDGRFLGRAGFSRYPASATNMSWAIRYGRKNGEMAMRQRSQAHWPPGFFRTRLRKPVHRF